MVLTRGRIATTGILALLLGVAVGLLGALPPVARAAVAPSGVPLPLGDLPGWHQTLADDFTQTVALGTVGDGGIANWPYAYNYPDTSARSDGTNSAWDSVRTISVHDGTLDFYEHTANGTAVSGTVGRKASQTYGRYVVRMKADTIPGYKTAFLLWPDSEAWPRDGEIDFPEGDLNSTVGGATHYQGGTSGGDQDVFDTATTYGGWHTYAIDWTPQAIVYSIDGTEVYRTTQRIPNTPMHWVLQSEAWIGSGQPPPSSSGHVLIDWATEYAYAPGAPGAPTPLPTRTATPMRTPTATVPVAPSRTPSPAPSPSPTSVTLPCVAYTARPDGRGGTTFACIP